MTVVVYFDSTDLHQVNIALHYAHISCYRFFKAENKVNSVKQVNEQRKRYAKIQKFMLAEKELQTRNIVEKESSKNARLRKFWLKWRMPLWRALLQNSLQRICCHMRWMERQIPHLGKEVYRLPKTLEKLVVVVGNCRKNVFMNLNRSDFDLLLLLAVQPYHTSC